MNWTYSIKNKMTAALALLVLCLLVLLSNFNDREHTNEVKESISTLYEDRLIAESYILQLTEGIYQIREVLTNSELKNTEPNTKVTAIFSDMNKIINAYETTKFTKAEAIKFTQFRVLLKQIVDTTEHTFQRKREYAENALLALRDLSTIQLEESKLIISKSEQLYSASKVSSEFAFAITIIILLVLQALVFASRTFHISNKKDINLN